MRKPLLFAPLLLFAAQMAHANFSVTLTVDDPEAAFVTYTSKTTSDSQASSNVLTLSKGTNTYTLETSDSSSEMAFAPASGDYALGTVSVDGKTISGDDLSGYSVKANSSINITTYNRVADRDNTAKGAKSFTVTVEGGVQGLTSQFNESDGGGSYASTLLTLDSGTKSYGYNPAYDESVTFSSNSLSAVYVNNVAQTFQGNTCRVTLSPGCDIRIVNTWGENNYSLKFSLPEGMTPADLFTLVDNSTGLPAGLLGDSMAYDIKAGSSFTAWLSILYKFESIKVNGEEILNEYKTNSQFSLLVRGDTFISVSATKRESVTAYIVLNGEECLSIAPGTAIHYPYMYDAPKTGRNTYELPRYENDVDLTIDPDYEFASVTLTDADGKPVSGNLILTNGNQSVTNVTDAKSVRVRLEDGYVLTVETRIPEQLYHIKIHTVDFSDQVNDYGVYADKAFIYPIRPSGGFEPAIQVNASLTEYVCKPASNQIKVMNPSNDKNSYIYLETKAGEWKQLLQGNGMSAPVTLNDGDALYFYKHSDTTPTGIGEVSSDSMKPAVKGIFNLQGMRVADSADDATRLPAGIYIINGRKVIVKNH